MAEKLNDYSNNRNLLQYYSGIEVLTYQVICVSRGAMNQLDKETMKALGLVPEKHVHSVNINEAIKLRFQRGLTYQEIANKQGVSLQAVHRALQPYYQLMEKGGTSLQDDSTAELLSAAATVHLIESVNPEKVAKMSGKDHAVSAGILLDKSRLFKGQSTSHTSVFFHVVNESDQSKPTIIDVTPEETDS